MHAPESAAPFASSAPLPSTVATRFGDIVVPPDSTIIFPNGLLGIPGRFRFFLADFPNPALKQFKLLQSLDETNLSFVTLPITPPHALIALQDISALGLELRIPLDHLVVLLLVSIESVEREGGTQKVHVSLNSRAPLIIDSQTRQAVQHVMTSAQYAVRHVVAS